MWVVWQKCVQCQSFTYPAVQLWLWGLFCEIKLRQEKNLCTTCCVFWWFLTVNLVFPKNPSAAKLEITKSNCKRCVRWELLMMAPSTFIFVTGMHLSSRCETAHFCDFPCEHDVHNGIINSTRQRNVITPLWKLLNMIVHQLFNL